MAKKPQDHQKPRPKPEVFPIPAVAMSAFALLMERFAKDRDVLGQQAVASLNRDPNEANVDYRVDFDRGVITRTVK